ncbi:MGMT family protein [Terriglobus sp.]|uniref:MGMT family protein n=1 Tax=Terriglobus sp. TaxID=1889013 RepID=UPI003B009B6D
MRKPVAQSLRRALIKTSLRQDPSRDKAFRDVIRSVPAGRVSTYGKVALAAGYPLYHRAVAKLLSASMHDALPWQRIVGAGGQIKLRGDAALEQRSRLEQEGVQFCGARVDMDEHEHTLRPWQYL